MSISSLNSEITIYYALEADPVPRESVSAAATGLPAVIAEEEPKNQEQSNGVGVKTETASGASAGITHNTNLLCEWIRHIL